MAVLRILVTGAAGLVGAQIVSELAELGHLVLCLVNRRAVIVPNNGKALSTPSWTFASGASPQAYLLPGDTRDLLLGQGDRYTQLAGSLDLIIHCAAITQFGRNPQDYQAVNTQGTEHVVSLACHRPEGPTPLIHVSTAYVSGTREGLVLEDDLDMGQTFGNPYERSKFEAEMIVRDAVAHRGLRALVARPSIVVGAAESGRIREFSNIYTVLKLVTEGRVRAIPGNYDALLDLVPIDYVASAIVHLATRPSWAGNMTYHLVGRSPVTLRDFSDVLAEYPSLQVPRFVAPHAFDPLAQTASEQRWYDKLVRLYESYFQRLGRFSNDAALRDIDVKPPPHGKQLIRKIIDYGERAGYFGRGGPDRADAARVVRA